MILCTTAYCQHAACRPCCYNIIGNAGDVSTGVVDNLSAIAAICKAQDLWFHIYGDYGITAAFIPKIKN